MKKSSLFIPFFSLVVALTPVTTFAAEHQGHSDGKGQQKAGHCSGGGHGQGDQAKKKQKMKQQREQMKKRISRIEQQLQQVNVKLDRLIEMQSQQ